MDDRLLLGSVWYEWTNLVARIPAYFNVSYPEAEHAVGAFRTNVWRELRTLLTKLQTEEAAVEAFFIKVVSRAEAPLPCS